MGKKLNPELPGNLRGSRLRKGIITLQRSEETSTVSAQTLAKQMSHSVSTAQKYYNIEEQARSDIRVASFLGSLVEKVADEKHTRVSEEVEGEEEKEKLNTYPIKLVREAEVQTVVVAGVKTNPDAPKKPSCQEMTLKVPLLPNNKKPFTLLKEEKMELIRLFQDIIKVGRVPAKIIYNQRKVHNTILKRVRYENAVAYLTKKSKKNITPSEKCRSWLRTGEITQVAASTTTSCGTTRYWTDLQAQILNDATRHLAMNCNMNDIIQAVVTNEACQDHKLADIFSRQQIRDKFRNIAKKRKTM